MSAYAAGNFTDAEGTIYAKDLDKSGGALQAEKRPDRHVLSSAGWAYYA